MPLRAGRMALAAIAMLLSAAGPAIAEQITVFAAASLKTALDEIAEGWQAGTGHIVRLSYASSAALARQIEAGAPADLFLSASPELMDHLEEGSHLRPGTRRDLLGNRLVLIAHGRGAAPVDLAGLDFAALLNGGHLAMGLVEAVPAGIYGKAALTALGQWEGVAPFVVQAGNVRAALALVATGEAPFGIVYATDANADDDVTAVASFPADLHPPIVYPVAVTADSPAPVTAAAFLAHLAGDAARAVFEAQGFAVLD